MIKKSNIDEDQQDFVVDALEEWAEIMHHEINITDYSFGWFGKHTNCC